MCVLHVRAREGQNSERAGEEDGRERGVEGGRKGKAGRKEKGRQEKARGKEDESSFTGGAVSTRRTIGTRCATGPC
jgi:hypothetical protein